MAIPFVAFLWIMVLLFRSNLDNKIILIVLAIFDRNAHRQPFSDYHSGLVHYRPRDSRFVYRAPLPGILHQVEWVAPVLEPVGR